MPKSKRNKQVELTKTAKHGMEGKKKLFREIQSSVENYAHLFIFSVTDMRNSKIKSVREKWRHSRFFIGKNKVMALALGNAPETEYRKNLHKISERLKGERGLLFSNQSPEEVLKWFGSYSEGDFARSGNRATETVVLKEGPLKEFTHNVEPYLRQLGLPTTLKKGVIHLVQDYTVCNEDDILTPESAKILKLLGYQMAEFMIKIECVWSQDGSFQNMLPEVEPKEITKNESNNNSPMEIEKIEISHSNISSGDSENNSDEDIPELNNLKNDKVENVKNNSSKISESMEDDENLNDSNKNGLNSDKREEKEDSDDEEIPILVGIDSNEDLLTPTEKSISNKEAKSNETNVLSNKRELRKRPAKIVK